MQNWKGYIQINGDCVSIFSTVDIKVSEKLYGKIQSALKKGKPLCECPFHNELIEKVENAFDLAGYLNLYDEKPLRKDFDERDDYLEALSDFNDSLEFVWDNYCLVSTIVDDPGDIIRFKKHFLGKFSSNYVGQSSVQFSWETDGETCARYGLTVCFDDSGKIIDIIDISADGLESESVKNSSYGTAYPDFDFMLENLNDELCLSEDE